MREVVDGLIDTALARGGSLDLVRDLAYPLPATVVFELLGVPTEDRLRFKSWGDRLIALANLPDDATIGAAVDAMNEAGPWARKMLEQRQEEPHEDMLSELLAGVDVGALTDEEVRVFVVTVIQFLLAGHETTTSVIGSGALTLLRYPEVRETLRREPELVPVAVEEFLRFESPLQYLTRRAARDVELGDRPVAARRARARRHRLGQPRRSAVLAPGRARRPSSPEQASRLRFEHPLLPRRGTRAPRRGSPSRRCFASTSTCASPESPVGGGTRCSAPRNAAGLRLLAACQSSQGGVPCELVSDPPARSGSH